MINAHVEVRHAITPEAKYVCASANYEVIQDTPALLEKYELQVDLADEVTYAAATIISMSRYFANDWAGIIDLLDGVLNENDAHPYWEGSSLGDLYSLRSYAHYKLGEIDQAIQDLQQATTLRPTNEEFLARLGSLYAMQGDYAAAIDAFDHALLEKPEWAEVRYERALAYTELQNFEFAIKDLELAIEQHYETACAYNQLGIVHKRQEQFLQALMDFDQATELNPELVYPYVNRAHLYADWTHNFEASVRELEQAVAQTGGDAEIFSWLGYYHERLGHTDEAIENYNQVLHAPDNDDYYDYALQHLEELSSN